MTNVIRFSNACTNERMPQNSPLTLRRFSASSALIVAFRAVALAAIITTSAAHPESPRNYPRQSPQQASPLHVRRLRRFRRPMQPPRRHLLRPLRNRPRHAKDLDAHVTKGESDDQILQAMVEQYGPTVLVEPPKKGFDLLAWIMPIAVPLIALVLVWEVVRRWRHKATLAPAGGPPVSSEFLARAQQEANREPGRENDV